jgi:hypothetical protein
MGLYPINNIGITKKTENFPIQMKRPCPWQHDEKIIWKKTIKNNKKHTHCDCNKDCKKAEHRKE